MQGRGGYEGNGIARMNGQNQNYNSLSQTLDYEASSSPMFLIQAPIAPLYRLERSLKKWKRDKISPSCSLYETNEQWKYVQEPLMTKEQRPFSSFTPEPYSVWERADCCRMT